MRPPLINLTREQGCSQFWISVFGFRGGFRFQFLNFGEVLDFGKVLDFGEVLDFKKVLDFGEVLNFGVGFSLQFRRYIC